MSKSIKQNLLSLWHNGLAVADPAAATARILRNEGGRLWGFKKRDLPKMIDLVAIGKSAVPMAAAATRVLKRRVGKGIVISPKGGVFRSRLSPHLQFIRADHPLPSLRSLRAGKKLETLIAASDRPILFLISGGASSLAVVPRKGITLAKKRAEVARLLKNGAGIAKLNRCRTAMSAIKGGKLLAQTKRPVASLIVSDVINNRLDIIASGLTVPAKRNRLIHNRLLLPMDAAAQRLTEVARRKGFRVHFLKTPWVGEASAAGRKLVKRARTLRGIDILISYGETTVHVRGKGKGGRNLEFALGAALELEGEKGISLLSIATDGKDGTSLAAGAFVDGTTVDRAQHLGLDPYEVFRKNNSETFFRKLGDLIITGPTGKNFADIQVTWMKFARNAR